VPPRIAAHLIVGPREEPFLGALLASLDGVVERVIVNDNAPGESPNAQTLQNSAFARRGALVVDRTPFTGFADARNVCMRLHQQLDAGDWVAFVDADEVHGDAVKHVSTHLDEVPAEFDRVEGYTWHFFGSFDWYMSIERRLMFHRFRPGVHWEGNVHEQLRGLPGKSVILPYVYAHYGHTLDVQRHAEKEWHYTNLGAPSKILDEAQLRNIDVPAYFAEYYPRLMRFRGTHPPAARATIESLRTELKPLHHLTDERAREQTPSTKMRNVLRRLNYEQRWRLRAINPLARHLVH
jgi:hypothetical protein